MMIMGVSIKNTTLYNSTFYQQSQQKKYPKNFGYFVFFCGFCYFFMNGISRIPMTGCIARSPNEMPRRFGGQSGDACPYGVFLSYSVTRTKCRGVSTPHPPLRGPKLAKSVCFPRWGRLSLRREPICKQMRPRPTEVMLKHIESVRAWGGGLLLRGSTEEVKTTGRPQVRTTEGSRRTAEFKVRNRMSLPPF